MIRPVQGGYAIFSHKTGKKLSKIYKRREQAESRLQQVEHFAKRRRGRA